MSVAVGIARAIADGLLQRLIVPRTVKRAAVGAAALLAVAAIAVSDPAERFDEFQDVPQEEVGDEDFVGSHLTSGSGSGRWQFWGEALDAFESEPLHGIGAGAYGSYWNRNAPINQVTGDAHSLYLEQLAELGLLGGGFLIAFVLWGPIASLRRGPPPPTPERAAAVALVAAGAVSAGLEWTWEVTAAFAPVVLALALLSGPAIGPVEKEDAQRRPLLGWGVACLLVGWLSLMLAFDTLLADRRLNASREAARDEDYGRAVDEARSAIALQPWAAEPRLQLALAYEADGDFTRAAEAAKEASARARDDWLIWLARTRIAVSDGDIDAAEKALNRARRLNPRAPLFTSIDGPLDIDGPPE